MPNEQNVNGCPTGIPRYLVHIEVWDNQTQEHVVLEQYNTDALLTAENDLRDAADRIEALDREAA